MAHLAPAYLEIQRKGWLWEVEVGSPRRGSLALAPSQLKPWKMWGGGMGDG